MCVSEVFKYARRQHTYMSKGLTCACRSSHHLFKIRFLSELCIFRDMSPFGMHRGAAVKKSVGAGRSTSRNPLGLEDLPQEIHWGWKIYLKKSIGAGRSTSRNPLGLEDLPQEIHWGWKIYIEPNASDAVLWRKRKKRSGFLLKTYCSWVRIALVHFLSCCVQKLTLFIFYFNLFCFE